MNPSPQKVQRKVQHDDKLPFLKMKTIFAKSTSDPVEVCWVCQACRLGKQSFSLHGRKMVANCIISPSWQSLGNFSPSATKKYSDLNAIIAIFRSSWLVFELFGQHCSQL